MAQKPYFLYTNKTVIGQFSVMEWAERAFLVETLFLGQICFGLTVTFEKVATWFYSHRFFSSGSDVLCSFSQRSNREMDCNKNCLSLEWTSSSLRECPRIRHVKIFWTPLVSQPNLEAESVRTVINSNYEFNTKLSYWNDFFAQIMQVLNK